MARLTGGDTAELSAMRSLCYQGLDSISLRERVGERLSRYLNAPSYCFGASDPDTALPMHSITSGLAPESMDAFFRLVLLVPALDFGPWARRSHRAATLDDLVEDVENDPYSREVLRPAGLRYEVQVACVQDGRTWGHLCLRRRTQEGPFAAHHLRMLNALAPHLATGLRSATARSTLAAVPGTQTGVVVLDAEGRIEIANGAAQRLFSLPSGDGNQRMLTAVNIVAARLKLALTTDHSAAPVPQLTITEEQSGEVYRLRGEQTTGADGRPRGLVLIEPAVMFAVPDKVQTLERLGLTRREAAVAAAVLRGLTTVAIAAELSVSPHTVHDHLRKVFEKLGVNSRHQLATKFLAQS